MRVLSIIPARSGSKGIPNKNILKINNKHLIGHTIELSLKSKQIDYTLVSTDSNKIKKISEGYGIEIPFLRPKKLSHDTSNIYDTVIYSLKKFEKISNLNFDIILILQPTSPLRKDIDIKNSIKLLSSNDYDSVISVTTYNGISPYIMYKSVKKGIELLENNKFYQRQQYKKIFYRNGLIYAIKRNTLLKKKSLYGNNIGFIVTPKRRSINLDNMSDLKIIKNYYK